MKRLISRIGRPPAPKLDPKITPQTEPRRELKWNGTNRTWTLKQWDNMGVPTISTLPATPFVQPKPKPVTYVLPSEPGSNPIRMRYHDLTETAQHQFAVNEGWVIEDNYYNIATRQFYARIKGTGSVTRFISEIPSDSLLGQRIRAGMNQTATPTRVPFSEGPLLGAINDTPEGSPVPIAEGAITRRISMSGTTNQQQVSREARASVIQAQSADALTVGSWAQVERSRYRDDETSNAGLTVERAAPCDDGTTDHLIRFFITSEPGMHLEARYTCNRPERIFYRLTDRLRGAIQGSDRRWYYAPTRMSFEAVIQNLNSQGTPAPAICLQPSASNPPITRVTMDERGVVIDGNRIGGATVTFEGLQSRPEGDYEWNENIADTGAGVIQLPVSFIPEEGTELMFQPMSSDERVARAIRDTAERARTSPPRPTPEDIENQFMSAPRQRTPGVTVATMSGPGAAEQQDVFTPINIVRLQDGIYDITFDYRTNGTRYRTLQRYALSPGSDVLHMQRDGIGVPTNRINGQDIALPVTLNVIQTFETLESRGVSMPTSFLVVYDQIRRRLNERDEDYGIGIDDLPDPNDYPDDV